MDYYSNINHGNHRRILLPADKADDLIAELESLVSALKDAIKGKDEIINAAAARIAELDRKRKTA